MVIRVATQDVESAQRLAASLIGHFGGEYVSVRSEGDVQVQLNGASGQRAMEQTFSSVERWLEDTGVESTDVWVDDRQYRLEV